MLKLFTDESSYRLNPALFPGIKPTPFRPMVWRALADECIEQEEFDWIMNGMTRGFTLGCKTSEGKRSAKNPRMENEAIEAVQKTIDEDSRYGEMSEVIACNEHLFEKRVVSPIYAIPKKELGEISEGNWRRIFHLSKRFFTNRLKLNIIPAVQIFKTECIEPESSREFKYANRKHVTTTNENEAKNFKKSKAAKGCAEQLLFFSTEH